MKLRGNVCVIPQYPHVCVLMCEYACMCVCDKSEMNGHTRMTFNSKTETYIIWRVLMLQSGVARRHSHNKPCGTAHFLFLLSET